MLFNCAYCPSKDVQIFFRSERLFGKLFSVECLACRKIDLPTVTSNDDDAASRLLYYLELFPELKPILYRAEVSHVGRTITIDVPNSFEMRMLNSGTLGQTFWELVKYLFPTNHIELKSDRPEMYLGGMA